MKQYLKLLTLAFVATALCFTACKKEEGKTEVAPTPTSFSKNLVLTDSLGVNSVTVQISGDDADFIRSFSETDLQFKAIDKKTMGEAKEKATNGGIVDQAPPQPMADVFDRTAKTLKIAVISKQLQADKGGISIGLSQGVTERGQVNIWVSTHGPGFIMAWGLPFYVEGWYWGGVSEGWSGWRILTLRPILLGHLELHVTQTTFGIFFWIAI